MNWVLNHTNKTYSCHSCWQYLPIFIKANTRLWHFNRVCVYLCLKNRSIHVLWIIFNSEDSKSHRRLQSTRKFKGDCKLPDVRWYQTARKVTGACKLPYLRRYQTARKIAGDCKLPNLKRLQTTRKATGDCKLPDLRWCKPPEIMFTGDLKSWSYFFFHWQKYQYIIFLGCLKNFGYLFSDGIWNSN